MPCKQCKKMHTEEPQPVANQSAKEILTYMETVLGKKVRGKKQRQNVLLEISFMIETS